MILLGYPEEETFPKHERTTYTLAAMVLAADALSNTTPAAGLFRGECLPAPLDLAEPHCGDAIEGCTVSDLPRRFTHRHGHRRGTAPGDPHHLQRHAQRRRGRGRGALRRGAAGAR